ncbi:hypothetical protein [Paenibacillus caui]|uniref:hypothetical protein n=1 Tax=Paenibacillus caui TaxID=2873927 RepID=UPI001CA8C0DC|nr:hypothetical protein [Paenibacillus caui]
MRKIPVVPGKSIGLAKLGMNENEINQLIRDSGIWYRVEYTDGLASFIEVPPDDTEGFFFHEIDLFRTKVRELVSQLDSISPYDKKHPALGSTYVFPEIGLSLWRSSRTIEEDIHKDWFKELPLDLQEDELKFLYFESVGVFRVEDKRYTSYDLYTF